MIEPRALHSLSGLIVQLPEAVGNGWPWWQFADGDLVKTGIADANADAGGFAQLVADGAAQPVLALVPSAQCPVRIEPLAGRLPAQAIVAARLQAEARAQPGIAATHAATAVSGDDLLIATTDIAAMQGWLDRLAAMGLDADVMLPTALLLDAPSQALIGCEAVLRTPSLALTAEPALLAAMGISEAAALAPSRTGGMLAAALAHPPLNLRRGRFAPPRRALLQQARWRRLAMMAAAAALLAIAIPLVEIARLHWDAGSREDAALAAARARFPAAIDLASAERLARNEMARRGIGPVAFATPAAALLGAMQPLPSLGLRDLGYGEAGLLRFTVAGPRADEINQLLTALQRQGWQVTVPPALAPDATGATVAAITMRAP